MKSILVIVFLLASIVTVFVIADHKINEFDPRWKEVVGIAYPQHNKAFKLDNANFHASIVFADKISTIKVDDYLGSSTEISSDEATLSLYGTREIVQKNLASACRSYGIPLSHQARFANLCQTAKQQIEKMQ